MITVIDRPDGSYYRIKFSPYVAGGSWFMEHINNTGDYRSFVKPIGWFKTIDEAKARAAR